MNTKLLSLMLIGFVALGSNSFAMQNETETETKAKTHFGKMDYLKLGAALIGCTWLGTSALFTPALIKESVINRYAEDFLFIPHMLFVPLTLMLINCEGAKDDQEAINKGIAFQAPFFGIASGLLGLYAYKKACQLRAHKLAQSKKAT